MEGERFDKTSPDPSAARQGPDPRRWQALALLGLAFFMVILDATIVLTAIPSMQEDLRFSVSGVQWVLTAYALAFGGLLLLCGRIADLMGRRRVFMTGLVIFVVSSLVCGLAWTGGVLIAARAVQGLAAAIMAPAALSIVMATFRIEAERNKALGVWGGLGGVGATAGLLVGGVVTHGLGWEWIFYINVPVGLVLFALSPVLLLESRDRSARSFDVAGALAITSALVMLVYAVIEAPDAGWVSVQTSGLLAAGSMLIVLFLVIETRTATPLVPLRVFRMRTLLGGNIAIFAVGMVVDGMLFPLTLYTQQVLGYTALQFGLLSAVMTVTSVAGALTGQAVVTRYGLRPVAVSGMLLLALGGLVLLRVSTDGPLAAVLLPGLLIFGAGLGASFVSSQIAALTDVAEEESGMAAGLVDTSFNIGSALGIAIVTTVMVTRTEHVLAEGGADVDELAALTEGVQFAFLTTIAFAAIGFLAGVGFFRSRGGASQRDVDEGSEAST